MTGLVYPVRFGGFLPPSQREVAARRADGGSLTTAAVITDVKEEYQEDKQRMKMKKRLLSILLGLVMALCLIPRLAFAEGPDTGVAGSGLQTVDSKPSQAIQATHMSVFTNYTGKNLNARVVEGNGALSYAVKSGGECIDVGTDGALTFKKAGTAYVTVTAAETDTYAETSVDVPVKVYDTYEYEITFQDVQYAVNNTIFSLNSLDIKLFDKDGTEVGSTTVTSPRNGGRVTVSATNFADRVEMTAHIQDSKLPGGSVTLTGSGGIGAPINVWPASNKVFTCNYGVNAPEPEYTPPVAKTNLTANGSEQTLVHKGSVSVGGVIQYCSGTESKPDAVHYYDWSELLNWTKQKEAGTYYVWWRIHNTSNGHSVGQGRSELDQQCIKVTIGKGTISPTVNIEGWTYGETAKTPTVTGNTGNGAVTYTYKAKDAEDSTYSNEVPSDAGEYTVRAGVAETGSFAAATATADFTISKAEQAAPVVSHTPAASQTAMDGSLTITDASKAWEYSVNGGSWTQVNAGTANVSNLAPEIYRVRYQEQANYLPGIVVEESLGYNLSGTVTWVYSYTATGAGNAGIVNENQRSKKARVTLLNHGASYSSQIINAGTAETSEGTTSANGTYTFNDLPVSVGGAATSFSVSAVALNEDSTENASYALSFSDMDQINPVLSFLQDCFTLPWKVTINSADVAPTVVYVKVLFDTDSGTYTSYAANEGKDKKYSIISQQDSVPRGTPCVVSVEGTEGHPYTASGSFPVWIYHPNTNTHSQYKILLTGFTAGGQYYSLEHDDPIISTGAEVVYSQDSKGANGTLEITVEKLNVPVVEFDPNGPEDAEKQYVYAGASTYTGKPQMYTVTEEQISKAQSPVWEGYTFQGWYDAKESGNPVSGPITLNSKVMLYAHWKKNLQDSWIQAVESQTYTGGAITPNVTVADGKTTLTAGKDYTVAFENNTNAGTASVKISAVTDSAYTGEATASFTIAKATPVVKAAASGITYGQTLNYSVLTGTARLGKSLVEGTFTWKNAGTEPAVSDSNQTEYDVVFTPDESEINFKEVELTAKLIVSKAVPTVTLQPAGRSLTYDGSEQELIVAGEAEGGKMEYSLDGATYGETVPKGSQAGSYMILYRVAGDDNHTSAGPFIVTATIARVGSSGAPVAKTLIYNGKAQTLVEEGAAEGGDMRYALGVDENTAPTKGWSDAEPTAVDAGTYYVWYYVKGDEGHNDSDAACVPVIINKANAVAATVAANNRTYDGTEKPLVTVAGEPTGGTMYYALGENATTALADNLYTTTISTATDAGTYYVWYKAAGDANHNDSEPGHVTAVIKAPISATVTFKVENGAWDDGKTEAKTATLEGWEGDTLTLAASDIPTAGTKPGDGYKEGGWEIAPVAGTAVSKDTTYTYKYAAKDIVVRKVTFKVVNGSWDDGNAADIILTLEGLEGDVLKLPADKIPSAGKKSAETYKAGGWDKTPVADAEITADTTYTYTYAEKDPISATVTFKVVNGSWDDGTTEDLKVTLAGFEGDSLYLAVDDVPDVGNKPAEGYAANGKWDTEPSVTDAESELVSGDPITKDTTYTYTYEKLPEPEPEPEPDKEIKDFVIRLYRVLLGREPDAEGLKGWMEALKSGKVSAAEIVRGFARSEEFILKYQTNAAIVRALYLAMLDREPDPEGLDAWTNVLATNPVEAVIKGLCGSVEFGAICKKYGIEPGTVDVPSVEAENAKRIKIEAFVKRCYYIILSRLPDEEGLKGWSDALEGKTAAAAQIIDGFVRSPEYINRSLTSEQSVTILYKTMLDRDPDEGGKAGWVDALSKGYTLQHIINGFCGSAEFTKICSDYGIQAGSVAVPTQSAAALEAQKLPDERIGNAVSADDAGIMVVNGYEPAEVEAFVKHAYRAALGREADEAGLAGWTEQIVSGAVTPKAFLRTLLFSDEQIARKLNNEQFIEMLYRLYLNRGMDDAAAERIAQLAAGGLDEVIKGFEGSAEFRLVLNGFGL